MLHSAGLVNAVKMYKLISIVLLVAAVYNTQCLPAQSSESDSQATINDRLQLFVNNDTSGVSYHLTPVFDNLASEDQQLNAELYAVLPYLNFLLGSVTGNGLEGCLDQLEIQLVLDS